MFDRAGLKEAAKARLSAGRSNAILVMLILTLLGGNLSGGGNVEFNFTSSDTGTEGNLTSLLEEHLSAEVAAGVIGFITVAALIGLAVAIFFTGILANSGRGWYLRYARGQYPEVGELFASFRIYKPVLKTTLLRDVYTFLWSLLFVIPGIVKSYAYSMTDYVIYENPNLTADEAITISRKLTDGAKGDLFVFDLSYIGWNLLNAFTFGILGIVYVHPYMYTAHAAIYDTLKLRAINSGILTWADFGQMPPAPPVYEPQPDAYPAAPDYPTETN